MEYGKKLSVQNIDHKLYIIIFWELFFSRLDQTVLLGLDEVVKSLAPGRGLILPHKIQLWCQVQTVYSFKKPQLWCQVYRLSF